MSELTKIIVELLGTSILILVVYTALEWLLKFKIKKENKK